MPGRCRRNTKVLKIRRGDNACQHARSEPTWFPGHGYPPSELTQASYPCTAWYARARWDAIICKRAIHVLHGMPERSE